ncbi:MAG: hypothetical protein R6X25_04410 [Candidatus Krumholzibacteriia bacterium]
MYDTIRALYEKDLKVPHNDFCRHTCDARHKVPILPWHIGSEYRKSDQRLVILREPHRSDQRMRKLESGIKDPRELADRLFRTESKAIWSYLRAFLERVHGSADEGWERIVLTSAVKCTNVGRNNPTARRTTQRMRESCIREVGMIRRELKRLRPTHLVAILDASYDDYLDDLRWAGDQAWWNLMQPDNKAECGKSTVAWFERELIGRGGRVRFLRVGPPQGKPRDAYVELLARWLAVGELPAVSTA